MEYEYDLNKLKIFPGQEIDQEKDNKNDLYVWGNVLLKLNEETFEDVMNKMISSKTSKNLLSEEGYFTRIKGYLKNLLERSSKSITVDEKRVLNGLSAESLSVGSVIQKLKENDLINNVSFDDMCNINDEELGKLIDDLINSLNIGTYKELKDEIKKLKEIKYCYDDIFDKNGSLKKDEVFEYGCGHYYNFNSENTIKYLLGVEYGQTYKTTCIVPSEIQRVNSSNWVEKVYELSEKDEIKTICNILLNGYICTKEIHVNSDNDDYKIYNYQNKFYITTKDDYEFEDVRYNIKEYDLLVVNCFANASYVCNQELKERLWNTIKNNINNIKKIDEN